MSSSSTNNASSDVFVATAAVRNQFEDDAKDPRITAEETRKNNLETESTSEEEESSKPPLQVMLNEEAMMMATAPLRNLSPRRGAESEVRFVAARSRTVSLFFFWLQRKSLNSHRL